jgi:hypothetical protein
MLATTLETLRAVSMSAIEKRLETALAKVRAFDHRRKEIDARWRAKVDTSALEGRLAAAEAKYRQSSSVEDLEAVALLELILEKVSDRIRGMRRAYQYGGDVIDNEFRKKCPNAFETLREVCRLRAEKVRIELEKIRESERKHLGPTFDDEQLAQSPLVHRAQSEVDTWEARATAINSKGSWQSQVVSVLEE